MAKISCCKDCIPPVRHIGCHSTCKQYLKEKEELEILKEKINADKTPCITNNDFYEVAFIDNKRYRRKRYKKYKNI